MRRNSASQIATVLLDIEGTTTPVDFVLKTLFPYAHQKIDSFLTEHFGDTEAQALMADLRALHQRDADAGLAPPAWTEQTDEARRLSSIEYLHWLMARDSKCTPLKTLQGKIWQQGYERGELHGEVYADVPAAFARWRRQGREICIYSSGSVLAQQLLFRSTPAGDLTKWISHFFDTCIGAKTESASYSKIAQLLGRRTNEVLFVSDASKEIDAARAASMQVLLCVRGANSARDSKHENVITTFDSILPDE